MKHVLIVSTLMVVLVSATVLPQAVTPPLNPVIGKWKQNMEKSVYNPGPPTPKGMGAVRQYATGAGGSIVAVTFKIDAQGLPSRATSAANYDGKEYAHTVATLATSLGSHVAPKIERTISYTQVNLYTVNLVQPVDADKGEATMYFLVLLTTLIHCERVSGALPITADRLLREAAKIV
jgi:hypothetical protein